MEPLEPLFAELVRNYAAFPGVTCECAAIAARPRPLYSISPASGYARPWMRQVSTLDPAFLEKTIDGMRAYELDGPVPAGLEPAIVRVDVPCLTFDELMAKHGAHRVDFINIDAEGLDYEIASTIDLTRWRPAIMTLETATMRDDQRRALDANFAANGYVFLEAFDGYSSIYVARRLLRARPFRVLARLSARVEAACGR